MLLSKKTSIKVSREYANLIGHMCYAASKLWNVCNYERQHYKETGMEQYPDWYYQKKAHKEDLWYKQLPSQTAQEVCKLLDKAWKSFYALKRSGGIETPSFFVMLTLVITDIPELGCCIAHMPDEVRIFPADLYGCFL